MKLFLIRASLQIAASRKPAVSLEISTLPTSCLAGPCQVRAAECGKQTPTAKCSFPNDYESVIHYVHVDTRTKKHSTLIISAFE